MSPPDLSGDILGSVSFVGTPHKTRTGDVSLVGPHKKNRCGVIGGSPIDRYRTPGPGGRPRLGLVSEMTDSNTLRSTRDTGGLVMTDRLKLCVMMQQRLWTVMTVRNHFVFPGKERRKHSLDTT